MGEAKGKSEKSFLETLPGILTATAALITAIGGCIAVIFGIPAITNMVFPPQPTPAATIQTSGIWTVEARHTQPLPDLPTDPTATPLSPTKVILIATASQTTSVASPKAYNFQACSTLCTGLNASASFPEASTKIYAQFNYENFLPAVKYVRTWSYNGIEWIRYNCYWDGPASGTEVLSLREPKGLRSGTWELRITVNNRVLLKEQIFLNGNWTYWDPAGTINACHGTTE